MFGKRAFVAVVLLASVLLVASASQSRPNAVSARADVVGSGKSWQMILTNTSTNNEVIHCMRAFAPAGVSFTSANGPAGTKLESASAFSNASLSIAPNDSAIFEFETTAQFGPGNPPGVNVSADCKQDFAAQVIVQVTPGRCKCDKIEAFLNKFHIFGPGTTRIEFNVNWRLTCTEGPGGCKGTVKVLAPRGADFLMQGGRNLRPAHPVIVTVKCAGPCGKAKNGKETLQYVAFQRVRGANGKVRMVPNPRFLPEGRANRAFTIKLSLSCYSAAGVPGPPMVKTLTLKFDRYGQVNYKTSDLNGDGRADGGQLKGF